MRFRRGENAQSRGVGSISSSLDVELSSKPANILRLVVDYGEHSAKEEEVACLHRLNVRAEWRRGGRELNTEVLQAAIRTGL